jgi:hypothetical protein
MDTNNTTETTMNNRPYCLDTYTDALAWSADRCAAQIRGNLAFLREQGGLLTSADVAAIIAENRAIIRARMERA